MANSLISALIFKWFFLIYLLVQAKCQEIVKEPLSLLVPVNKTGMFSCKALCIGFYCNGYWIIDGVQHIVVNKHGMMSNFHSPNTNEYTLTLTVNASEGMNNTSIQCRYEALSGNMNGITHSATVYLFVISSSPISPNPSIAKNPTHFVLLWSPPFLWPGQRIQHYNISMINTYNGSIAYHMVDTTSTTPFVTVSIPMDSSSLQQFNTQNILSCPKITFSISPVDGTTAEPMQTFNISDWAWNFPSESEFTIPAINSSVLFKADGAPALVEVYVQIPTTICSFHELNFTLVVENKQGNLMAEINTFPNPDSGVIKEDIKLDLKENQEYSLRLRVMAQSQTATSQKHIFSTHILVNNSKCSTCNSSKITTSKTNSVLPYVTLTGVFGALTLVLLVAFLVVTVYLCIHHRKTVTEIKLSESKSRVCNVMVHNPIYDGDGPVYESVPTQLEGNNETELNIISQTEDTTDRQYDNLRLSSNDTVRYIDPPVQLQYLYNNTVSDSANAPINRSASVSMPQTTPRVMALKKNGQERNKLHLTLSLGGNDSTNGHISEVASKQITKMCAVAPADMDEPYTVMSPASVRITH